MFSKFITLITIIGIVPMLFLGGCQKDLAAVTVKESESALTEEASQTSGTGKPAAMKEIQGKEAVKEESPFFSESESFASQYKDWFDRNPDFVGWVSVKALKISEPVVRGADNQEYLRADIDGNYRKAGTVFMDYRNIGNDFDSHMILYGHNLKDDQMFGPLRQYLDGLMEDLPLIEYESLYGKERYQVFSVYRIQADDYQYQLVNDENYLQRLLDLSEIDVDYEPYAGSKILTLSTCSYEEKNERLVVHATRIEETNE